MCYFMDVELLLIFIEQFNKKNYEICSGLVEEIGKTFHNKEIKDVNSLNFKH